MNEANLEVIVGTTIYASTGMFGRNQADRMSSERFYRAEKGCTIKLLDSNYLFNIATYAYKIDDSLIYTYAYADTGFAVTYNHDLSGTTYRSDDYVFGHDCVYRICLKRIDGKDFTQDEADRINDIIYAEVAHYVLEHNNVFDDETQTTVTEINSVSTKNALKLCVLTDSHISVCGTWNDTVENIKRVHEKVNFDAIIHLGDFTDGMTSKKCTSEIVKLAISDLKSCNIPVYVAIGNHDSNYFQGNPEPMSVVEQCDTYLAHLDDVIREDGKPWYYRDFDNHKIRLIFLHSFDMCKINRYGFSNEELAWLEKTLNDTPNDFSVMVFSHIPPHTKLDYWSKRIRNQEKMVRILKKFNKHNKLLAYVHGHTHADYTYTGYGFPVISVGCSKLEYFTEYKPDNSHTEERYIDTVTQDLWDAFIVDTKENSLEIVRFGAGNNRSIKRGD